MQFKPLHRLSTETATETAINIVDDVAHTAADRLTAAQVALMDCPEKSPIRRIDAILRIQRARASILRTLESVRDDLYGF